MINEEEMKKVTVCLPVTVYDVLRNQADRENMSVPEFICWKVAPGPSTLKSKGSEVDGMVLSKLPLGELLAVTAPVSGYADERLNFFHD